MYHFLMWGVNSRNFRRLGPLEYPLYLSLVALALSFRQTWQRCPRKAQNQASPDGKPMHQQENTWEYLRVLYDIVYYISVIIKYVY